MAISRDNRECSKTSKPSLAQKIILDGGLEIGQNPIHAELRRKGRGG